jgi:CBS-domain-containing membrane protein
MTSVVMTFELTQAYQIPVPPRGANQLRVVISKRYQPGPVYDAMLQPDPIPLPSAAMRAPLGWTARDVMNTGMSFLSPDTSIDAAWAVMNADARQTQMVGTPDHLRGLLTVEQLTSVRLAGRGHETVESALDDTFRHVHPDHSLEVVLSRFTEGPGLLPVVSRAAVQHVEGVIGPDEITRLLEQRRAYRASQ